MTSYAQPKFYRDNLIGEPIKVGPRDYRPDLLGSRLLGLYKALTVFTIYTVRGDDPLTSICFDFYRTTSLWWVVTGVNGYGHPLEIQPGDNLQMPLLSQINAYFARNQQRTGTRVFLG